MDKEALFQMVINRDAGWQDMVHTHWYCLSPDDRQRIQILAM